MKFGSELLTSLTIDLCPDVVKWTDDDQLICGTYEVLDSKSTSIAYDMNRKGSLLLLEIHDQELKIINSINTEAIFDMNYVSNEVFSTADAKGKLTLYKIEDDNFKFVSDLKVYEKDLAVSIDWKSSSQEVLVTGSNGYISVIQVSESNMVIVDAWKAHDYEAWAACYDIWNDKIMYTGGDDAMFLTWDLRDRQTPKNQNKSHDAGVCCISCNKNVDNQLLTGSYDEYLRLWDTRKLRHPLNEVKLNGGVWKIHFHPEIKNLLAATCMYEGTKIVGASGDKLTVGGIVTGPGPLSYGAAWSSVGTKYEQNMLATCTFYDKIIKIHNINKNT